MSIIHFRQIKKSYICKLQKASKLYVVKIKYVFILFMIHQIKRIAPELHEKALRNEI